MKKQCYVKRDVCETKDQDSHVQVCRGDFSVYIKAQMGDAKVNAFAKVGSSEGNDTMFVMECDVEKANEITREWDVSRKRRKANQDSGYQTISLSEYDDEDQSIRGDEMIPDESVNVEEEAIRNIMIEEMLKTIRSLPEEERDLIEALYLNGDHTEKSYGAANGMSQQTVHYNKNRILKKLRTMLGGIN